MQKRVFCIFKELIYLEAEIPLFTDKQQRIASQLVLGNKRNKKEIKVNRNRKRNKKEIEVKSANTKLKPQKRRQMRGKTVY